MIKRRTTSLRRCFAIATTPLTIGILVTGCSIRSFAQLTPSTQTFPVNELLCPFSGTEVLFTLVPVASDELDISDVTAAEAAAADATASDETIDPNLLGVATIFANRLQSLDLGPTAVVLREPNQLLVQFPEAIPTDDHDTAIQVLTQNGHLTLRPQRAGINPEQLNLLMAERIQLEYSPPDPNSQIEHQAALQQMNQSILSLFHAPVITGDRVQQATAQPLTSGSGQWQIDIEFDPQGADKFTQVTQQIAGTERALGIFWDDTLISSPRVSVAYASTGITGGRAVISGNFSAAEARAIALQLSSGPLPAPIDLTEVQAIQRDELCAPQS